MFVLYIFLYSAAKDNLLIWLRFILTQIAFFDNSFCPTKNKLIALKSIQNKRITFINDALHMPVPLNNI